MLGTARHLTDCGFRHGHYYLHACEPLGYPAVLQYWEKVMQTIIAEYRSLFLRYIDDMSAIYRTYKRCVAMIIRRDISADISFLRYIAAVIYRSCDISS